MVHNRCKEVEDVAKKLGYSKVKGQQSHGQAIFTNKKAPRELRYINYLVDEILLYDDRVEIKYKTPLTIGPDESRGFSFYEKIVLMPIIQNKREPLFKEVLLIKSI